MFGTLEKSCMGLIMVLATVISSKPSVNFFKIKNKTLTAARGQTHMSPKPRAENVAIINMNW